MLRRLWLLVILTWAVGCAAKPPELPDLHYQGQLPVYAPSKLTNQMGSQTGPDFGVITHEGMAWWLETEDSPDKVIAFYDGKIRAHKLDKPEMEGALAEYKWAPTGGEQGEDLSVFITKEGDKTEIHLHEGVKVGKRKSQ